MKTLALDQSSHITGYAIYNNTQLIEYGYFELTNPDIGKRLINFKEKINELIQQYEIEEIAYEDITLQHGAVTVYKTLAFIIGILNELIAEKNLKQQCILPSSWRHTCGIKGKVRKDQKKNTMDYVNNKYNIKATEDECDAICIGEHATKNREFDWS